MIAARSSHLVDAAATLGGDAIHVWQLDFRPTQGRQPLLRTLAAYLGIDAGDVTLVDGAHGRPRLDHRHGSTLDFNWSHSGNHALIAVARGIAPGIDVERRRPRPHALPLARRFFGSDEADAIAALPEETRAAAFLEVWTAKEALLKAHGRGLGYGLQRLRVLSTEAELRLLRFDGEDIDVWQLQRLVISVDLIAALAWRGSPRTIQLQMLASTD
ncbi:MAG: 4'-phosphopantetheinyl transferase superfamily protein [Rhodanobacter sp.]|nr:MAG: 4'-phosphopantetheinyl transferase superfamily protein [Rhodanobacter sp.]TAM01608.1 MAG: 4'-phosphopantetheinyl transferase superfamily protein [Rhodanobacter sp.]TAM43036.1 MAG: 4'-phosphopantetheinyl transferase superfamily protein [Rhodanobacter sp.]TAN25571.1 MAG: 4'-phosphopantetheinyl transferase superfamily protein [Rhodanobacter sp.]